MGGPFHEPPYLPLQYQDFGPGLPYRVDVQNNGRTIVLGDPTDLGFQRTHAYVTPGPDEIDVVIHGLPGRFIERLGGKREIPVPVVVMLLDDAGVPRGTPLRLLTCHAGELPAMGSSVAEHLASEWGGTVNGANGLLRISRRTIRVDLVEWVPDPILGGMMPTNVRQGQGVWGLHIP